MEHIKHLLQGSDIYLLVFWMDPSTLISALNMLVELDQLYLI